MNVLAAMQDTVKLAHSNGMRSGGDMGYDHIAGMQMRMQEEKLSYGKMCRWLGWAQCAVVAAGAGTLDDMKNINRKHAGEK